MSVQLDPVARLPDAAVWRHGHAQGQQQALLLLLLALAAIVLLYHATFWSMLELWSRSQTFAHGFLIVPISCWLAWRPRPPPGPPGPPPPPRRGGGGLVFVNTTPPTAG
ncbi:archaeosortase/exosortase family protein, partial [Janthinobacterium sp. BJB401]|uniref:archaeosortase/exosortase family protein n=1 Tax=Janthinobacterium sp. BJB401 TaxID=2745934 RepID=UPI0015959D8D